jgi:xanthine dehydrogenase YagR molybdenum-binding subunit
MPDTNIGAQIGVPRSRVDGPLKVTGAADYAGDFATPDLAYGYIVNSTIARGRIIEIDTAAAESLPGVLHILTHANRPPAPYAGKPYQDDVAPPGAPFRPLENDQIAFSGQPIALVVAESFEAARDAASLLRVTYAAEPHSMDLDVGRGRAAEPTEPRSGIAPPPEPRGDLAAALKSATVTVEQEYKIAAEHHNPMEPHASTVIWQNDGSLLVHDKVQGVSASQKFIMNVFGLNGVRVVSPFVGGGFGAGLRPQYQLFLAMLAALELKRSVRVVMTRDQMFTFTHRPETIQRITLSATNDGTLQGLRHEAIAETSRFEQYQEVVVNWSGLLYSVDNAAFSYKLVPLDRYTPGDMRAPGSPTGTFAIESAMDELAEAVDADPVELRLKNYADKDHNENKPFGSKELRAAIARGADRFGWERRTHAPRSMREGRDLIGYGMAIGAWEAMMMETTAKAVLRADGTLELSSATADIGTGTYTILSQIGAEMLGLPMGRTVVKLADTDLPEAPLEGGSWTAASAGMAVQAACLGLRKELLAMAQTLPGSALADASMADVVFVDGHIMMDGDRSRRVSYAEAMRATGVSAIEADGKGAADEEKKKKFSSYTHSACFVEVRVDEMLGQVRVTRVVNAVAAGRILNPKTARSQIIGGVVMGLGMALHEEAMPDHAAGRFMNHNFAEYHVPANADVPDIDVIFVDEHDEGNPLGIKGLGEIGIVATPAAIANAIWHATGKRQRSLPITIDKVFSETP